MKMHSSCEIEDFVETHLCKLCVILRSRVLRVSCVSSLRIFFFFFFAHFHFPASGQAVVPGVVPSSPRFLPSTFIAHTSRVQQAHCSSIVHRVLLTHALALSARQLCARHVRHIRYFFHGPMHMTKSKKAKSLSKDAQPLARGPLESPRIMTS